MARIRARLFVLLTACIAMAVPALAQKPADADISGVYRCDGVNPQGRPYRGMVEIVKLHDAFQLRWTFPQDENPALGIGILSNGVLAVSYYGGDMAGVVVYKINEGKPMVGEWTVVGSEGGVFKETLTRLPGHGSSDGGTERPTERAPRRPATIGDPSTIIKG
ncbi:MAG: hypothetical protein ABL971_00220 [Vicinamibacterales bacterium]